MNKLIINNISKEDAIELCNDFFGDMMWSKEEDGVIRAYPSSSKYPCEVIKEKEIDIDKVKIARANLFKLAEKKGLMYSEIACISEPLWEITSRRYLVKRKWWLFWK